jgi:hypothetical protein
VALFLFGGAQRARRTSVAQAMDGRERPGLGFGAKTRRPGFSIGHLQLDFSDLAYQLTTMGFDNELLFN